MQCFKDGKIQHGKGYRLLKKNKSYYMINFIFEEEDVAYRAFVELLEYISKNPWLFSNCMKLLYRYREEK